MPPKRSRANSVIPQWILGLLQQGIEAVPATKFALGGIVFAIVAFLIFTIFSNKITLAIFGTFFGFVLAILVVIFAQLVRIDPRLFLAPVLVFIWSTTIMTVSFGVLLSTSFFFDQPIERNELLRIFQITSVNLTEESQTEPEEPRTTIENDYLSLFLEPLQNKVSVKIEEKSLKYKISNNQRIKLNDTNYNKVYITNVQYKEIKNDEIWINSLVEWKKLEKNLLQGGEYERGKIKCNIETSFELLEQGKGTEVKPSENKETDCSTSSSFVLESEFDLNEIQDNLLDNLSPIISFLTNKDLVSISQMLLELSDYSSSYYPPLKDDVKPFLEKFHQLNLEPKNNISLYDIELDSSGILLIFSCSQKVTEVLLNI